MTIAFSGARSFSINELDKIGGLERFTNDITQNLYNAEEYIDKAVEQLQEAEILTKNSDQKQHIAIALALCTGIAFWIKESQSWKDESISKTHER